MMKRAIVLWVLALAGGRAPLLRAQAPVASVRTPSNTLRFANAPLEDVIVAMGQMIGLTVVATDVPDKRVTLNTASPVRTAELGAILESLLESHEIGRAWCRERVYSSV